MSMVKTKRSIVTSYVLLILFTAVVLLPFIWMFLSSFKSQRTFPVPSDADTKQMDVQ